ncbi:Nitrite extrusion protein 2, partial [human gut metagenome]
MAGHHSRYKTLLNSSDFPSVVRLLHFTGSELSIICSLMT